MYARVTSLEIDTLRVSMSDALKVFEEMVVPEVTKLPGFLGVFALGTPEGRAMLISFWDTAEHADASESGGWYPAVIRENMTIFRAPPGLEHYEVQYALPPPVPANTR